MTLREVCGPLGQCQGVFIHHDITDLIHYEVEENGRQVAFDENGAKVDPIVLFAQRQHIFAEGPDFLLSDSILYPHYYLIMQKIPEQTLSELLPKTLKWYRKTFI